MNELMDGLDIYVGCELDIADQTVRLDPVTDENGASTSITKLKTQGCEIEMVLGEGQTSLELPSIDDVGNMFGFDDLPMSEDADQLESQINEALNKLGSFQVESEDGEASGNSEVADASAITAPIYFWCVRVSQTSTIM